MNYCPNCGDSLNQDHVHTPREKTARELCREAVEKALTEENLTEEWIHDVFDQECSEVAEEVKHTEEARAKRRAEYRERERLEELAERKRRAEAQPEQNHAWHDAVYRANQRRKTQN